MSLKPLFLRGIDNNFVTFKFYLITVYLRLWSFEVSFWISI